MIKLSADNPAHADRLAELGIAPNVTVLSRAYARKANRHRFKRRRDELGTLSTASERIVTSGYSLLSVARVVTPDTRMGPRLSLKRRSTSNHDEPRPERLPAYSEGRRYSRIPGLVEASHSIFSDRELFQYVVIRVHSRDNTCSIPILVLLSEGVDKSIDCRCRRGLVPVPRLMRVRQTNAAVSVAEILRPDF
jgi:hypothetical protein